MASDGIRPAVHAPSNTDAHREPSRQKREDQDRAGTGDGLACQRVGTFFAKFRQQVKKSLS
jgi:hypothetical protein